jgi:hypothetical protein
MAILHHQLTRVRVHVWGWLILGCQTAVRSSLHGRQEIFQLRQGGSFQFLSVRHGDIGSTNSFHGSIQIIKGIGFHNHGSDFGPNSRLRPSLFQSDTTACLFDTVQNGIPVEGTDRQQVDDLTGGSLSSQDFRRFQGKTNFLGVGNNGNVGSSPFNLGLANFDDVILGLFFAGNAEALAINKSYFWEPVALDGTALSGWALIAAMGVAMVGSIFSSDAWNNITFAGAEVKNPKRNIPLSLVTGVTLVTILYILANFVYLNALPLRGMADGAGVFERGIQQAVNDRLGSASMFGLFGSMAALLMAAFVVISTFGCNNGLILSGARVYYAMAKDDLFFKSAGKLNKNSVPAAGLKVQAIWASLLCLSGTYSNLLDYVVFAVLIFYVLTIAGIFVLRRKKPEVERPYKTFGYPVIPILYMAAASLIMFVLLVYKPEYSGSGLIIVIIGIPVYYAWTKWGGKGKSEK